MFNSDVQPGALLVATPNLTDPNFAESVVVIVGHDDSGTFGVILNRPSTMHIDVALEDPPHDAESWENFVSGDPVIWVGGPVHPESVRALGIATRLTDHSRWLTINDSVGLVAISNGPVGEIGDLDALRIFSGHADWAEGQLDEEIASGSWFVVPSQPDDLFTDEPDLLWSRVLHRQGGVFLTATVVPEEN